MPSAPLGLQAPTSVANVSTQMAAAGDGAVGVVLITQPGSTVSHVINVVNRGGKVFFIDTQMGKIVTLNPNLIVSNPELFKPDSFGGKEFNYLLKNGYEFVKEGLNNSRF